MYIPCVFQTRYKGLDDNVQLALLGDSPVLGEWTPRKAILAEPVGHNGVHEVVVMLQAKSICHFKWCLINESFHIIYWEKHKERAFKVEAPLMYIQAPWDMDCYVMPIKNPPLSSFNSKHKMVLVTFQMNLPNDFQATKQQLNLLGNDRALGGWLVNESRVAQCTNTTGRVTVYLPAGKEVEFKWMVKIYDNPVTREVWEDGPNRSYRIENNTVTLIECDWDAGQSYWICQHSGLRPKEFLPLTSARDMFAFLNMIGLFRPGIKHCVYAGLAAALGYGLYKGLNYVRS